ncbi:MAG: ribosome biogenesis GTPase Der [Granulosicoccus sp.]
MKPVIALVGRPNVGKSTLFNKLTRTQDALVADLPGLTRDRQYGDGKVGGWPYLLIDTGGLSGAPETLDAAMADQTLVAVREADVVVFIVDGRAGLVSVDEDIAMLLRRTAKQVVLCVNKIDGVGEDKAQLEFHQLGFDITVGTAASHNRGVHYLIETIADLLEIDPADRVEESRSRRRKRERKPKVELDADGFPLPTGEASAGDDSPCAKTNGLPDNGDENKQLPKLQEDVRIAFIGRPNVGKSTLINRLIGEQRVIAYDQPGTTRDAVSIPFTRAGRDYTLIDTAGVRRRGKVSGKVEIFSIIKTLQAIDHSNVCVMLLDGSDSITEQDLSLLGYIIEKGRALVVAVNKWDSLNTEQREAVRTDLERRVEFLQFTRIHFISALEGSGVGDVFKSINKAYASAFIDLATPRLTRLLEVAVGKHQPPMINGRRIKLRYAHQGGQNPPLIVIHGNQSSKVPKSYQRYLANYFTKVLRLFGTPLRIEFRQGENPFARRGRVSKKVTGKELREKRQEQRRSARSGSDVGTVNSRKKRATKVAANKKRGAVGKKRR